jgi:hypothetical protein
MLKKIGVTAAALLGLAVLATPPKANAGVRINVNLGAPAYAVPAPVYGYDQGYVNTYPVYQAPVYVAPSFGWRDHDDHDRRDHGREQFRRDDHGRRNDFRDNNHGRR